jgi:hypothetical protein
MKASEIFLTDEEFEALFGAEISAVTRVLNETSLGKCSACGGMCCRDIGCELYSRKFGRCPIYDIRPRECRYHFCHAIFEAAPLSKEEKGLLQKPINEFFSGNKEQLSRMFPLFPVFAVSSEGLALLGIKREVKSIMDGFEQGRLDQNQAKHLLQNVCRPKQGLDSGLKVS